MPKVECWTCHIMKPFGHTNFMRIINESLRIERLQPDIYILYISFMFTTVFRSFQRKEGCSPNYGPYYGFEIFVCMRVCKLRRAKTFEQIEAVARHFRFDQLRTAYMYNRMKCCMTIATLCPEYITLHTPTWLCLIVNHEINRKTARLSII